MIERLKKLSPVHIWLLSTVISVVVTESIAGGVGILLNGGVIHDYLLKGFVASLFVAGIAGGFLNSYLSRKRKIEADIHLAATASTAQEDAVIGDTADTGMAAKEDAGRIDQHIATPHGAIGRKPAEEPTGNGKKHADIRLAIRNLDVLPAMPAIAQKLLALDMDTEEGERMMLLLIEQDPQISAKILGLANSAMFGVSHNIKTVRHAALLLGIKRVQSVAASIAILSLMAKTPAGEFNIQDLWLHSFRIAFVMQSIARFMPEKMRPSDDQIFLAGMLHDIGYLVLAYLDPKLSDKLHNHLAAEPERPVMEVEREILDICHDELGAELAHHWNLPEEIIAVLRYHHSPDAAGAAFGQPLVRMINIAEKLLPSFGIIEYVAPDIVTGEWEALGINPSRAEEVKEQAEERAEQAVQFAGSFA
jgi:putative nucleotidyltransferase with HDIG domain